MRRVALAGAVLLAALGATASPPAATTPSVTIHAEFRSIARATYYTLVTTGVPVGEIPVVFWKLDLVQIDTNGQVDATCNKTEQGATQSEFIWHHGDNEGCNHAKEGTHGHQGRITATVHMRDWDCSTTYDGSSGDPPDGPTKLCTSNGPAAAVGPCDDETARVAQLDAEIEATQESIKLVDAAYQSAYYKNLNAEYRYYYEYYKADPSTREVGDAWDGWNDAHNDYARLYKSYSGLLGRLFVLRQARADAARAASQCNVKAPNGRVPRARCTTAFVAAARAQGRFSGYSLVARAFTSRKLTSTSAATHALARRLRAAAAKAPAAQRARLLTDSKRADGAANALAADGRGLTTIQRKQAAAGQSSKLAQQALSRCRTG